MEQTTIPIQSLNNPLHKQTIKQSKFFAETSRTFFQLKFSKFNGMLRHAFERLEGGNILWLIVGPAPPVPPIFSLFLSPDLILLPVWLENSLKERVVNYKSPSSEI